MKVDTFFEGFHVFPPYFKDINSDLLQFKEETLVRHLQDYSSNYNLDHRLDGMLDKMASFQKYVPLYEGNIKINRSRPLRVLLLVYYRVLKLLMAHNIDVTNMEGRDMEIERSISRLIAEMSSEEKVRMFQEAEKQLSPEPWNEDEKNLMTILERAIDPSNHDHQLLVDLKNELRYNPGTLFYPSSHIDTTDVNYFNAAGNELLEEHTLFVHVHFMESDQPECPWGFSEESVVFETYYAEDSKVTISRFSSRDKYYWVILFSNTRNEQILLQLLENQVRIDTLFCKCDGITSGMGHEGYSVNTPLYICFSNHLQLKRIITEYATHCFTDETAQYLNAGLEEFNSWLENNLPSEIAIPIKEKIAGKTFTEVLSLYTENETLMDETYQGNLLDSRGDGLNIYLVTPKRGID